MSKKTYTAFMNSLNTFHMDIMYDEERDQFYLNRATGDPCVEEYWQRRYSDFKNGYNAMNGILKEEVCHAHMAGQHSADGCDPSWYEAYSYYTHNVKEE